MAGLCARADAPTNSLAIEAVVISGGNGNSQIDRRECNDLGLFLRNLSGEPLTGLMATLVAHTPGAEITAAISAYPDLPPGGAGANLVPFQLGTAGWFACGTPIDLELTVTAPNLTNILTIRQSTPTNCVSGGGACPSTLVFGGAFTGVELRQSGRLVRTGTNSLCSRDTSCPGLSSEPVLIRRRFDAWSIANRSGETNCITVELITRCSLGGFPMFSAAYRGRFDPTDLCRNYLADIGRSPSPANAASYSFKVPPAEKFVIVVNEVNDAGCVDYTVRVTTDAGFIVYEPPLGIRRNNGTVTLFWPTNAWDYHLESAPQPEHALFTTDTNVPVILGEDFTVTESTSAPSRYYRLARPW